MMGLQHCIAKEQHHLSFRRKWFTGSLLERGNVRNSHSNEVSQRHMLDPGIVGLYTQAR
jgi:hypothetical protein